MKLKEKEEAITLRKQGFSLREISLKLGVSKSSASLWMRDVPLSKHAQKILDDKFTNGQLAAQKSKRAETDRRLIVAKEIGHRTVQSAEMDSDAKRILCAMVYWCEGAKSRNDQSFIFTNSDPTLVRTFLGLFRKGFVLDEKKFRVAMHLHDYHDEKKQLLFWSKVTNIPLPQFLRSYRKPHTGKQIHEGYAGCISVRYHDVEVAREIQAIARAFMAK